MVLMLGVVIPISDALTKPVEHADYRQVYYIYMHGIGILCIVYLNALIACNQDHRAPTGATTAAVVVEAPTQCDGNAKPAAGKADGEETDDASTRPKQPDDKSRTEANGTIRRDPPKSLWLQPASVGDPSRAPTLCTRSDKEKPAGDVAEIELATFIVVDRPEEGVASSRMAVDTVSVTSVNLKKRSRMPQMMRKRLLTPLQRKITRTWRSPSVIATSVNEDGSGSVKKVTWAAVGVNLYLRLGAIVFGFGVMIHDGFKIADVIERPGIEVCTGPWFLPKQAIHLIFIMCQTYYVFKHHRVTINTQKAFVAFTFVHLIVTNLCIWMKTVIYEISVGLSHSNEHETGVKLVSNSTGVYHPARPANHSNATISA